MYAHVQSCACAIDDGYIQSRFLIEGTGWWGEEKKLTKMNNKKLNVKNNTTITIR